MLFFFVGKLLKIFAFANLLLLQKGLDTQTIAVIIYNRRQHNVEQNIHIFSNLIDSVVMQLKKSGEKSVMIERKNSFSFQETSSVRCEVAILIRTSL